MGLSWLKCVTSAVTLLCFIAWLAGHEMDLAQVAGIQPVDAGNSNSTTAATAQAPSDSMIDLRTLVLDIPIDHARLVNAKYGTPGRLYVGTFGTSSDSMINLRAPVVLDTPTGATPNLVEAGEHGPDYPYLFGLPSRYQSSSLADSSLCTVCQAARTVAAQKQTTYVLRLRL